MSTTAAEKKYKVWIVLLSVVIPIAVAVLFTVKLSDFGLEVAPLTFLPPIYAGINGATAILLVMALIAVKKGDVLRHEKLMKACIALSVMFLVMYVAYHMTSDSTLYGDINHDGVLQATEEAALNSIMRYGYYFILLTHILLSIAVIPLVLVTYVRALAKRFDKHRKIAKITFPIWLYIAITGVIVYVMISPYYA